MNQTYYARIHGSSPNYILLKTEQNFLQKKPAKQIIKSIEQEKQIN